MKQTTIIRICPAEVETVLSDDLKVYYKGYEIPGVYAIELTDHTLKILLDKAVILQGEKRNDQEKI